MTDAPPPEVPQEPTDEPAESIPPPDPPDSAPPTDGGAVPLEGEPNSEERTLALLAHLLGIITLFLGPLIIWLVKKDSSMFTEDQSKEALNFQIGMTGAWVLSTAIGCLPLIKLLSCALFPILFVVNVVFCVLAAVEANKGVRYRYPVAIRLIN